MEGSQALTSMDTKSLEVLLASHGRGPLLFIAPRAKLAVTLHWAKIGPTGRSGRVDWTLDLSVRSPDDSHVSPAFNGILPISMVIF